MASKQTVLQQKIKECAKKIRELGSLPSDALDKYKYVLQKQLFKQLEKTNRELKEESYRPGRASRQRASSRRRRRRLRESFCWDATASRTRWGLRHPGPRPARGERSPAHPPTPRACESRAGRVGRHLR